MSKLDTREKIIHVAIDLMSKKGFKAVTIKEIAKKASISEMTVFRHFGTKKNILEEAIDHFYYTVPMKKLFENKITWDIEKDLTLITHVYHQTMKKNKKVIQVALKEGEVVPDLFEQINKHPRQLKEFLIEYFIKMQGMKKIKLDIDPETFAMLYLYMNYGEFVSHSFVSGHMITSISETDFINSTIDFFVNYLKN